MTATACAHTTTADGLSEIAVGLSSLSVALTFGAILIGIAAIGYGFLLRSWVKREAREGAKEYFRTREGKVALEDITVTLSSSAFAPVQDVPTTASDLPGTRGL